MFIIITVVAVAIANSAIGHPLDTPLYNVEDFLSSRIVGGQDASQGSAKHMAALVHGELITNLVCGGSIITTRHILSAAHCIEPFVIWGELLPSYRAVIGSNQWNSDRTVARFSSFVIHEGWDWWTIKNDIGVLITSKDIVMSKWVGTAALNFDWMGGGQNCYVTGWGRTGHGGIPENLQMLNVKTISPQQCIDGVNEAAQVWGSAPPVDPKIEICTFHSVGHGMCNGDSGSALMLRDKNEQIGIVSWGFACALGAPDVFVRIGGFKDFLTKTITEFP